MFEPWVYKWLCCIGLVLLAYALMHSNLSWLRRLGLWLVFATLGLAVWFVTESRLLALIALVGWFVWPLVYAVYASRRLRFSLSRRLIKERQEVEDFEDWMSLSEDLRNAGFDLDGEYGLKPSPIDYGFRLFQHREKNRVAGLGLVRQGGMALSYVLVVSRADDGTLWVTWDYPMPYGLKMPPHLNLFRCLEVASVEELLAQHEEFLALNEVVESAEKAEPKEVFDAMFGDTMRYNLNIGLLRASKKSEEEILYSWRGTLFITWQVLRDMVSG
jgi:hypothetical protein